MEALLAAALAVPAALALAARLAGSGAGAVAAFGAMAAALPALALLIGAANGTHEMMTFEWLPAAGLEFGLRLDGLSAAMSALVAVAGVAALLHARGYFVRSDRAPQAHAALLAFLAAMQGLVLADNLLTLLVFWELVGALSARLIAYERDDARAAPGAIRAFLTTRSADVGLYLAIAALFAGTGTVSFDAARPEGFLGAAVGLGIVVAAAGKSAQLPFQTWLSGAMAGPTPVSALLHSATMVAAGVYLLVRAQELLVGWPLEVVGWLGALTAVAAAGFALAQRDLKMVLASSTTSQLGLMFVAAGAAVPGAAIFHLVAHAAGKAGMFLAAGVFQRRRSDTGLAELAGVADEERAAFWGFAVSAASIAAVPPLAAFWSKDAVLKASEHQAAWFVLVAVASIGTAAYLLRPILALRRPGRGGSAPAGRRWMLASIGLLAVGSLTLGAVGTPLGELIGEEVPPASALTVGVSLAALAAGLGVVAARVRAPAGVAPLAERQLGTNDAIRAGVVRPILRLAAVAGRVDSAIDGIVDAIGRGAPRLAGLSDWIDAAVDAVVDRVGRGTLGLARGNDIVERRGVDAAVDGLAALVERGGGQLPRAQTGQTYEYLRNTVIGMTVVACLLTITAIA
jgi:NADH-quinone oxidoreductase subunit L